MEDVVTQQTEQLIVWLKIVHSDLTNICVSMSIIGVIVIAMLIIIAFKKRRD